MSYPKLSAEEIRTRPEARQDAMRRLVQLLEYQSLGRSHDMIGSYITREMHKERRHDAYIENISLGEWLLNVALSKSWRDATVTQYPTLFTNDSDPFTDETLRHFGLPYDKNLLKDLLQDWKDEAEAFRINGASYHLGSTDYIDSPLAISPQDYSATDILGMVIFGDLREEELTLFPDWWRGTPRPLHESIMPISEWVQPLRFSYPTLCNPTEEIIEAIASGHVSYDEVVDNSRELNLLETEKLHQTKAGVEFRNLRGKAKDTCKKLCSEPLSYNPNGLNIDKLEDDSYLITAIRKHEYELARHIMKHTPPGTLAGHDVPRYVLLSLVEGDLATFDAMLHWVEKQGHPNPLSRTIASIDNTRNNAPGSYTLFEYVLDSADIKTVLPKIDYLTERGFTPYAKKKRLTLVSHYFSEKFPIAYVGDVKNYADTMVGMLQRGWARTENNWLQAGDGDVSMLGNAGSTQMPSNETLRSAVEQYKATVLSSANAFINDYESNPSIRPLDWDDTTPFPTPENMTAQHLIEYFSVNTLESVLTSPRWHGKEDILLGLVLQLPQNIQDDIHRLETPNRSLMHGAQRLMEKVERPIGKWTSHIEQPDTMALTR